jgi:hypothetical protein
MKIAKSMNVVRRLNFFDYEENRERGKKSIKSL